MIVMENNIEKYFKRSIVEYNRGDVEKLLKAKLDCAGPLLIVVLNGIDTLGGMCYGFRPGNSKERSVKFMTEKMGVAESVASFLYSVVRCGIVHQGMPKIGLTFFVWYDRIDKGNIFYKCSKNFIWLNVGELTYLYIDTVDRISKEPDKHVSFIPITGDDILDTFNKANEKIKDDISQLTTRISEKDNKEQRMGYNTGEIKAISSSSAYTQENTLLVSGTYPID